MQIVTTVSARIAEEQAEGLVDAYAAMSDSELPDGLIGSLLLRGADGLWQISTTWRDRAALDAMRATGETPTAIRLFTEAGGEPAVAVFEVAATVSG